MGPHDVLQLVPPQVLVLPPLPPQVLQPVLRSARFLHSSHIPTTSGTPYLTLDAIGDEGDDDGEVDDDVVDTSNAAEDDENDDEPAIAFSGKKKASKGGKKGGSVFAAANFSALDDAEDRDEKNDEDDDIPQITFTGKKKKSSKNSKKSDGNSFSAALLEDEEITNKQT